MRLSLKSFTGVADPQGHETGLFLIRKPHMEAAQQEIRVRSGRDDKV